MVSSTSPKSMMIAGNWKMFKNTQEAVSFTESLAQLCVSIPVNALPDVVLCVPFTLLQVVESTVKKLNAPFIVAAQTMESRDQGAYTGEISPLMLKDIGIQTVVIGHSERRQYFNETDETVNQKVLSAVQHEILPIVCVGESLEQRESGQTDVVIQSQVTHALKNLASADLSKIVLAYEPIWAIGTGKTCETVEANRVCGLIRSVVKGLYPSETTVVSGLKILYGGSVKPDNSDELTQQPEIHGALVGGASLEASSFFKIIQSGCLVKA